MDPIRHPPLLSSIRWNVENPSCLDATSKMLCPLKSFYFHLVGYHGKIATKYELHRRGLLEANAVLCTTCSTKIETLSHLFFTCLVAWKIWMNNCSLWGLKWVHPSDATNFFVAWQHTIPLSGAAEIWNRLFFSLIWSLWLCKNEILFQGKHLDTDKTQGYYFSKVGTLV